MDELEKSAHKIFKLKYHFVFCVKYRKDMFLNNNYCETFTYTCKQMEARYSMKFETIGFDEDHVHFLVESLTTTYSACKNIPSCKKYNCKRAFQNTFRNKRRTLSWRILE